MKLEEQKDSTKCSDIKVAQLQTYTFWNVVKLLAQLQSSL